MPCTTSHAINCAPRAQTSFTMRARFIGRGDSLGDASCENKGCGIYRINAGKLAPLVDCAFSC